MKHFPLQNPETLLNMSSSGGENVRPNKSNHREDRLVIHLCRVTQMPNSLWLLWDSLYKGRVHRVLHALSVVPSSWATDAQQFRGGSPPPQKISRTSFPTKVCTPLSSDSSFPEEPVEGLQHIRERNQSKWGSLRWEGNLWKSPHPTPWLKQGHPPTKPVALVSSSFQPCSGKWEAPVEGNNSGCLTSPQGCYRT